MAYLAHEFGGFHFSSSGNDLALTDPLGLSCHGEGILQVIAEDDIFDEHGLNHDTPAGSHLLDDFGG